VFIYGRVIRGSSQAAVPQRAPPIQKGEGDHVNNSPERDTPRRGPARGPGTGSGASWRYAAQSLVTLQVQSLVTLQVWAGALLVCLGLLLGSTWTIQALQSRLCRQAEERRRLNEEWAAMRAAHQQRAQCPRCKAPLSERDW